jgi:hypothetical protein
MGIINKKFVTYSKLGIRELANEGRDWNVNIRVFVKVSTEFEL